MIGQLPNSQTEKKRLGDTLLDLAVLSHEEQHLSSGLAQIVQDSGRWVREPEGSRLKAEGGSGSQDLTPET